MHTIQHEQFKTVFSESRIYPFRNMNRYFPLYFRRPVFLYVAEYAISVTRQEDV